MLTFAFIHHPYLVRILFGMPSLHLFTFLMFFKSLTIVHQQSLFQHIKNSKYQQELKYFLSLQSLGF